MEGTSEQIGHRSSHTSRAKKSDGDLAISKNAEHATADTEESETAGARANFVQPQPLLSARFQEHVEVKPRDRVEVSLKSLLQAGVHFGHQTSRWNPKMGPYIHSSRNGIHIIDLPKSVQCWKIAREKIVSIVAQGGSLLFVGTKKQAESAITEEATRSSSYYVSRRWLGGMITNFQTIRKSIDRMNKIEQIIQKEEEAIASGQAPKFTKKERLMLSREWDKLNFSLGGIRTMTSVPQLMFVIDIKREEIAIREAQRLNIPVIAIVDTNCDPNNVDLPIPSNDDGTRAIRLFCEAVADAVLEGREQFQARGGVVTVKQREFMIDSRPAYDKYVENEGAEAEKAKGAATEVVPESSGKTS